MIKRIHRAFLKTILAYTVYFLGGIGLLIYGYIATNGGNLIVTLTFVFFLLTIFVTSYASDRLTYFMNLSYLHRIYERQGEPLQVTRMHDLSQLTAYLKQHDYKLHKRDQRHAFFYRVKHDHIKKMLAMNILEVVIYLNKDETEFYIDEYNDEINQLKDSLYNQKIKVNRLLITQIKHIDNLDDTTKKQLAEIIFIRTRHNIISTVNIGILDNTYAVMEYSDTYSPSLYYTYHIDEIKSMV